jgi:hypothetical protein
MPFFIFGKTVRFADGRGNNAAQNAYRLLPIKKNGSEKTQEPQ